MHQAGKRAGGGGGWPVFRAGGAAHSVSNATFLRLRNTGDRFFETTPHLFTRNTKIRGLVIRAMILRPRVPSSAMYNWRIYFKSEVLKPPAFIRSH